MIWDRCLRGYFVVGTDVHFLALGEISTGTNVRSPRQTLSFDLICHTLLYIKWFVRIGQNVTLKILHSVKTPSKNLQYAAIFREVLTLEKRDYTFWNCQNHSFNLICITLRSDKEHRS